MSSEFTTFDYDNYDLNLKQRELIDRLSFFYFQDDKLQSKKLFFKDELSSLVLQCYEFEKYNQIHKSYTAICHDTWSVFAIGNRLVDSKILFKNECITDIRYRTYLAMDIEFLHVLMRSIFDHVSVIIKTVVGHPNLSYSFNNLVFKSERNIKKLNPELKIFIEKYSSENSFFCFYRYIRDQFVHNGVSTYIFIHGNEENPHFAIANLKRKAKENQGTKRYKLYEYYSCLVFNYLILRKDLFEVMNSYLKCIIQDNHQGYLIEDFKFIDFLTTFFVDKKYENVHISNLRKYCFNS